ncbi:MAG: cytochrome P460 family protein [Aggregatilineaceae bacterium]
MIRLQRVILASVVLVAALLIGTAVVLASGAQETGPIAAQGPGSTGAELLDYILNQNPYTTWKSWTADRWNDYGGYLVGGSPHGATIRIFVNDVALAAVEAEDFDGVLPYGSIIVKENYMGTPEEPGDVAALTVMYKLEGFNPAGGDWFWLKTPGDGSAIDAEGAVEGCISCHAQEGNADYMLRYHFGAEPAVFYGEPLPEASGEALLDYVLNTNPYTAWGSWPANEVDDFTGFLTSGEPHGATVRIFVNDRALNAIARDNFEGVLPPGSIVVKENYMGTVEAPGEVAALTIMYKVDGFNPEANDWFWLKAPGDGSAVDAAGVVEGCINCHGQQGNSDYLLRYDLPAGKMPGEAAGGAAIDANALIDTRCTVCHTRDRIDREQKDADGWAAIVDRMIGYGAQLTPEERDALIAYLSNR